MWRRTDGVFAGILFVMSSALYASTAARYVLGGDNPEFLTLAVAGGVAHPPGYPLYELYLSLAALFPSAWMPTSASGLTVVLGVGALLALYRAMRCWGAEPVPALLTAFLYAVSPRAWIAATHAEVFALHALLAALIVAFTAPRVRLGPAKLGALALLAGLGLSNHLSIVLLAPLGLTKVWFSLLDVKRSLGKPGLWRSTALGLSGLALGLAPYALLVVEARHDNPWSWGNPDSAAALLRHFLRTDYGTTSLSATHQSRAPLEHIGSCLGHVVGDLFFWPLLLIPVGLAVLMAPPRARSERVTGLALFVAFIASGPLFAALFNLPTAGLGRWAIERFFLLPELVASVLMAVGLTFVFAWLRKVAKRWGPALVGSVLVLSVLVHGALGSRLEVHEHHGPWVEQYLENTLMSAPERAIIVGTGDHRYFGFGYSRVRGKRTDLNYIDAYMLLYPWYRTRMQRALGVALPVVQDRSVDTSRLLATLLSTRRPLFLSNLFRPKVLRRFKAYPLGTLVRVLPPGARTPPPAYVQHENLELYARFRLSDELPKDPNSWGWNVQLEYVRIWQTLAKSHRAAGAKDLERVARAMARRLDPRPSRHRTQRSLPVAGAVLHDTGHP